MELIKGIISIYNKSLKKKLTELKLKISTLDSDEGIRIDSGRGTKIFLNKRPDTYVVEIVREKNSNMKHSGEDIRFIQNIEDVIALVVKTLGKSFSVIEYYPLLYSPWIDFVTNFLPISIERMKV